MSTPVPPVLPRARAVVETAGGVFDAVGRTGSTNADLLAVASGRSHGSVVVTLDQTAGRGRLDRSWSAPAGQTLAVSLLVRADLDDRDRGWLPLVAGTAMRDAVSTVVPDVDEPGRASRPDDDDAAADRTPATEPRVLVKWPNDVLVDGRKVCGILCQVADDGSVVVGAGVNLTIPVDALPTPTSTSLAVAGARDDAMALADAVLSVWATAVLEAVGALVAGGPGADGVRSDVRAACGTIGRRVRLEQPDGSVDEVDATGIDDDGRITIRDRDGRSRGVAVGDLTHLRYA
ncbi:biotin--[acetyl-CoA-carboxylase] ligase [Curtobacterium sp. SGAir0471]|uniref:biotin--[acetyl-CoA-carboxylase] ligase n=1 Tax=Curtobacterium sp. SGAir0471 TaxID=2070337 RepID=UPI0010CCC174|nr:biotin--[acetyl-CoA-carboxylase] ligase [Curtobacterium sp. SGAir0471]QCR43908.1 biotin--[acetyl-CoA-carboxylase] ligase [Curtobacterium sp. SGAir0471]